MHPSMKAFAGEIPVGDPEKMAEFQSTMDSLAGATNKYIERIARELNISEPCALDVWYLRTRSRWTQASEIELIRLHRAGTPPNIFDWPKA